MVVDETRYANLKQSIRGVWQTLAMDIEGDFSNAECIEIAIDANYLTTYGYAAAETYLNELLEQNTYMVVTEALCRDINLL